jgi:anthraniloyl-CoA monooxygenase
VTATAKFIWFGTTYPFDGLTFVHEQGPHGVFAVHGSPIGGGVSTFIVETDEPSWRAAGLDGFDVSQPPGPSDEVSRAYLEKLFAAQIGGCPLLVNNSRWGNFRTWRTRRWRHRAGPTAVALLGDAAHTAHFSVGSGTKMAMEDAIALVAALEGVDQGDRTDPDTIDAALAVYENERSGLVTRIQDAARPSLSWWEHFGRSYRHLPPWQFAFHFFSRSLPESKLRQRDAGFTGAVHAAWRQAHAGAEVLATPLTVAGTQQPNRLISVTTAPANPVTLANPVNPTSLSGNINPTSITVHLAAGPLPLLAGPPHPPARDPWGLRITAPDSEDGLDQAERAVGRGLAAGACLVAVDGGTALTRRLLCETARLEHGAVTMLIEDGTEDTARTAVLSGRADLVGVPA